MNAAMHSAVAQELTDMLLQPREEYLKHRAPRSDYVHDIRRKIKALVARPIAMLLAVSFADLDDGVALSIVTQPYDGMIAILRAHAARRARRSGIPWEQRVHRVIERETIAQGKLDVAQGRVNANPTCIPLLMELRQASREYAAVQGELDLLIDEYWAESTLAASRGVAS